MCEGAGRRSLLSTVIIGLSNAISHESAGVLRQQVIDFNATSDFPLVDYVDRELGDLPFHVMSTQYGLHFVPSELRGMMGDMNLNKQELMKVAWLYDCSDHNEGDVNNLIRSLQICDKVMSLHGPNYCELRDGRVRCRKNFRKI